MFQVESEGMRRTLSAVKPTASRTSSRSTRSTGPARWTTSRCSADRKNGQEPIEYPHPLLEGILEETYGIFVYQEQVMQAAQMLAGYSLGGADLLRRAMGKKIQSEMDAQRATFVEGCATHNSIPAAKANELFDLIDKFAGYGFNKSHAAAYALLDLSDRLAEGAPPRRILCRLDELRHGADRQARDVRRGHAPRRGRVPAARHQRQPRALHGRESGGRVRYALGALKGVGEKAMEALVEERERGGPFTSLEDFAARIDPRLLNRRQLESLAGAGAFDAIKPERAAVFAAAETILAHAASAHDQRDQRPGGAVRRELGRSRADPACRAMRRWTLAQRMAAERDAFGFYFSAHPVDARSTCSPRTRSGPSPSWPKSGSPKASASARPWRRWSRTRAGARRRAGRRYMMATLSDSSGQFVATAFDDEPTAALEAAAKAGQCGLLTVELDRRAGDETPRVTIKRFQPLSELAKRTRLQMTVRVPDGAIAERSSRELAGRARRQRPGALHRPARVGRRGERRRRPRLRARRASLPPRIERITGEGSVDLSVQEPPKLALVG